MNDITIAYIQADLVWENSKANLVKFENIFKDVGNVDIVILPEMFNTGFTMNISSQAQELSGSAVTWMKEQAILNKFMIMGSLIISNDGKYYNRLIAAHTDGSIEWYDKAHLFSMGLENVSLTAGSQMLITEYSGWNIRPLICYDLRFPVWSRNRNNYDMLVYVANWPASRRSAWKTLLKARAIENQCYVIGVNRVGTDGEGIVYAGDSVIIDPYGSVISELPNGTEDVGTATISLTKLHSFRDNFPVNNDADSFIIRK